MAGKQEMPMKTPLDLFVHELSDIHSGEQIIAKMLSEAQGMVKDQTVKQGLRQHEQETRQHIRNLEQVFQQLGQKPHPVKCHVAEGLHEEITDVAQSKPSPEVLEGAIVGGAAKTEHYEIASYTGLIKKATAMGQKEVAQLLQQNLEQEQAMLQRVEGVSEQLTQRMASMMGTARPAEQPGAPA